MVRAKKGRASKSAKIASKLFIKPTSSKALPAQEPPSFEQLPVDREQCRKAVHALVQHAKKTVAKKAESDLLAGEENESVWLGVALKQMSPKDNHKPVRIPLPNPLLDPRKNPVCLLVKDPQREYKDLLEEKKIKFISRVVGMEKLQGKFKPFEARRQLMKENDLFLVDDRIVPEMPRVLGKSWLQAKKSPIPVTLKRADLKGELERAISSTYLRINKGTTLSVKIGSLDAHTAEQMLENLVAAIPHLAVRIPMGGWDNIQALHIKTNTSVALPIWNSSLSTADDGENAGQSRFFIPPINEAEIEAKKAEREARDKRIRAKKEKREGGASTSKAVEAGSLDEIAGLEDAALELDPDVDDDEEDGKLDEDVEEIDESVKLDVPPTPESATKKSKKTKATAAASPAAQEKKKVSSTSKKLKGMDSVKGLPRKAKKSAKA